jgi:predicted extracellular nuclease
MLRWALELRLAGLTELENNASVSLQDLVDSLNALTAPGTYAFADTGTIGGDAIKVGFLYRPALVTPVGGPAILDNTVEASARSRRDGGRPRTTLLPRHHHSSSHHEARRHRHAPYKHTGAWHRAAHRQPDSCHIARDA